MRDDPAGYYARLEIDPAASQAAVTAAFRRKARALHPDVPGTGSAEAFMRMKEAYDVLSDAQRRVAYDRSAHAAMPAPVMPRRAARPVARTPRVSGAAIALWTAIVGAFCLAMGMIFYEAYRPSAPRRIAQPVAPITAPARRNEAPPPEVVAAKGAPPTHYVQPSGGVTTLWRHGATRDEYVPTGQLPPFTSVRALRLLPQHGLVEIRLADGTIGLVNAARLAPGNAAAARRAYCAYNAGPSPANGDVLERRGTGDGQMTIENRGDGPAVVKLRTASGAAAATVFMAPGGTTTVTGLPDQRYRPDIATGELWSRACQSFAAGMRAQRYAVEGTLAALSPFVIPPNPSTVAPPHDIPDAAFVRD